MTPKTDAAALTTLADLLDGPAFDTVFGAIQDIRNDHPRIRDEDGDPLDIDSGDLVLRLITELRRTATEQPT